MRARKILNIRPSFKEENLLYREGYRLIAGLDEAGRGALAGPIVAAAVILPRKIRADWLEKIMDSKLLSPKKRLVLFDYICDAATGVSFGMVSHDYIDRCGIASANRLAMQEAIKQLEPSPDFLLIDYLRLPDVPLPQKGITDGDAICTSIACASIVAKVIRDRIMITLDTVVPGYNLSQHKGYGTKEHIHYLKKLGPSSIHRLSFQPLRDWLTPKLPL